MRVLVAAVIVTVVWAAMDRTFGVVLDFTPTDLITTFFAALAGAAVMAVPEVDKP